MQTVGLHRIFDREASLAAHGLNRIAHVAVDPNPQAEINFHQSWICLGGQY